MYAEYFSQGDLVSWTKLNNLYRVGQKKYYCLNWCNINTKRAITIKQVYWYSSMSNLNFDICHAHFHAILTKILYVQLNGSKHF